LNIDFKSSYAQRVATRNKALLFLPPHPERISERRAVSSVILARDILASVIGHERGCDQAEHRANPDVDGDRIRGVIGAEKPSGDQRRRAAGDDGSKLIAQRGADARTLSGRSQLNLMLLILVRCTNRANRHANPQGS
jgi:hypothetical protein